MNEYGGVHILSADKIDQREARAPIRAWEVKLENMTDKPTNRPTSLQMDRPCHRDVSLRIKNKDIISLYLKFLLREHDNGSLVKWEDVEPPQLQDNNLPIILGSELIYYNPMHHLILFPSKK